jgi:DNA-binding transcriptional ArsR family regulator
MEPERPVPAHELNDPREIRAMAHPLRLRLIEELAALGTATASELAERVGESPANCSWHLRLLAKYGFVEEAGGGEGRRRPWRVVPRSNRWGQRDDNVELMTAADIATGVILEQELVALRDWIAWRRSEAAEWRDASAMIQSIGWFTAAELAAVNQEIWALLTRHAERITDPAARPPGARLVRTVAWGFPDRRFGGEDGSGEVAGRA